MHRIEKPFRAGPPTPRNALPTSLPDGYGHLHIPDPAIADRDVACREWVERNYEGIGASAREIMIAKTAFAAGWSSHRVNQLENNSPEPVDLRCEMCKSDD